MTLVKELRSAFAELIGTVSLRSVPLVVTVVSVCVFNNQSFIAQF